MQVSGAAGADGAPDMALVIVAPSPDAALNPQAGAPWEGGHSGNLWRWQVTLADLGTAPCTVPFLVV